MAPQEEGGTVANATTSHPAHSTRDSATEANDEGENNKELLEEMHYCVLSFHAIVKPGTFFFCVQFDTFTVSSHPGVQQYRVLPNP
jgi:hypothetical protein